MVAFQRALCSMAGGLGARRRKKQKAGGSIRKWKNLHFVQICSSYFFRADFLVSGFWFMLQISQLVKVSIVLILIPR